MGTFALNILCASSCSCASHCHWFLRMNMSEIILNWKLKFPLTVASHLTSSPVYVCITVPDPIHRLDWLGWVASRERFTDFTSPSTVNAVKAIEAARLKTDAMAGQYEGQWQASLNSPAVNVQHLSWLLFLFVLVSGFWFWFMSFFSMSCCVLCFVFPCLVSHVLIFHALMCPLSSPLWLPLSVVLFPPGLFLCAPPPRYLTWFPSSSLLTCFLSCH